MILILDFPVLDILSKHLYYLNNFHFVLSFFSKGGRCLFLCVVNPWLSKMCYWYTFSVAFIVHVVPCSTHGLLSVSWTDLYSFSPHDMAEMMWRKTPNNQSINLYSICRQCLRQTGPWDFSAPCSGCLRIWTALWTPATCWSCSNHWCRFSSLCGNILCT